MPLIRVLIVAVALLIVGCAPMGDAWLDFGGVVADPSGHPIEGAKLRILVNGAALKRDGEAVTDARGHYEFYAHSCPCDFTFRLTAAAPGFKAYTLDLSGAQANRLTKRDITLEPQ